MGSRSNLGKIVLISIVFILLIVVLTACVFGTADDDNTSKKAKYSLEEAYALAQKAGFSGTSEEFLAAFGANGAYEAAVNNGFEGTEREWLDSLFAKGITQIVKTATVGETETYAIYFKDGDIMKVSFTLVSATSEITVTFVPEGGQIGDYESHGLTYSDGNYIIVLESGEKFTKLPKAWRAGYEFDGWYTETGENSIIWDANEEITENLILYAKWRDKREGNTYEPVYAGDIVSERITDANAWREAVMSITEQDPKGLNFSELYIEEICDRETGQLYDFGSRKCYYDYGKIYGEYASEKATYYEFTGGEEPWTKYTYEKTNWVKRIDVNSTHDSKISFFDSPYMEFALSFLADSYEEAKYDQTYGGYIISTDTGEYYLKFMHNRVVYICQATPISEDDFKLFILHNDDKLSGSPIESLTDAEILERFVNNKEIYISDIGETTVTLPSENVVEEEPNYLTKMINSFIDGGDALLKPLADVTKGVYISADIVLKCKVGEKVSETVVTIKSSADKNSSARNWVSIEIVCAERVITLYFETDALGKETAYLGENITGSDLIWRRLGQFEASDYPELTGLLTGTGGIREKIFSGISEIEEKYDLQEGLFSNAISEYVGIISMLNSAIHSVKTENGYKTEVFLNKFGRLIPTLLSLTENNNGIKSVLEVVTVLITGLSPDIMNDVSIINEAEFSELELITEFDEESVLRDVIIKCARNATGCVSTCFEIGVCNINIEAESRSAVVPFSGTSPEEFAFDLAIRLDLPSINGESVAIKATAHVNPAITIGVDRDGYMDFRFDKFESYVTYEYERGDYLSEIATIATYSSEVGGLILNLKPVFDSIGETSGNGIYDFFIKIDLNDIWAQTLADKKAKDAAQAAENEKNDGTNKPSEATKILYWLCVEENRDSVMAAITVLRSLLYSISESDTIYEERPTGTSYNYVITDITEIIDRAAEEIKNGDNKDYLITMFDQSGNPVKCYISDLIAPESVLENIVALIMRLKYNLRYDSTQSNKISYDEYVNSREYIGVEEIQRIMKNIGISILPDDNYAAFEPISFGYYYGDGAGIVLGAGEIRVSAEVSICSYVAPESITEKPQEMTKTLGGTTYTNYVGYKTNDELFKLTLAEIINVFVLGTKFERETIIVF